MAVIYNIRLNALLTFLPELLSLFQAISKLVSVEILFKKFVLDFVIKINLYCRSRATTMTSADHKIKNHRLVSPWYKCWRITSTLSHQSLHRMWQVSAFSAYDCQQHKYIYIKLFTFNIVDKIKILTVDFYIVSVRTALLATPRVSST